MFQDGEELGFDTPEGVAATQYVVDLINEHHVAPSAADTNDNGDFSRDQFLQGKLALFQTGAYNIANIRDGADFEWAIASSAGAITTMSGTQRRKLRSKLPAWVAPSGPTTPPRSMANSTSSCCSATSWIS